MKRFLSLVLIFAICLTVFVGCAKPAEPSTSNTEAAEQSSGQTSEEKSDRTASTAATPESVKGKNFKIALVKEWGTGTHMVTHINAVKKEAEELGMQVNVVDANHDIVKMADGINAAVEEGVDAILISHGKPDGLKSAVEEALKAGIPVIAFDIDFDIDSEIADGLLISLDQNDLMLALLALEKLVQDIDGEGNIVYSYLYGVAPTDKRDRIYKAVLQTYPRVKEVARFQASPSNAMAEAQQRMEAVLTANPQKGDIDAVFAVWDEYAKGCFNAITQKKRDEIKLYGIDMSDQDLAMMQDKSGVWKAAAAVDPAVIGQVQVRLALKALAGERIPRYYSLQPVLVKLDDLPKDKRVTVNELPNIYDGWGSSDEFLTDWMKAIKASK